MKAVLGIPTVGSKLSIQIVKDLSPFFEHILVVTNPKTAESGMLRQSMFIPGTEFVTVSPDRNMRPARNRIFEWGLSFSDIDWIFQVDDDLRLPDMVKFLEWCRKMTTFPQVGFISSQPDVYTNWNADILSLPEDPAMLISASPTQLWGARPEMILETGGMRLDVLEDIELGCNAWSHGWATMWCNEPGIFHRSVRQRYNKAPEKGGELTSYRDSIMDAGAEKLFALHGPLPGTGMLKGVTVRTLKSGAKAQMVRYNWEAMVAKVNERWGQNSLGYSDTKGRRI